MPTPTNAHDQELLAHLTRTAELAARTGGDVLKKWLGKISVTEKNAGDYVTQADFESQKAIADLIRKEFPEHGFLGEESSPINKTISEIKESPNDYCWVVDPLDGTVNYIHQLHSFSVSIGVMKGSEVLAACVFDPIIDEIYLATRGKGATLNGKPIQSSGRQNCDGALIVCSFPSNIARGDANFRRFENVLCDTNASVRRLGSAALNLSYVACGRLDAYWATAVNIWDVAAGVLILEEAGGQMHSIEPNKDFDIYTPKFVAATTPELFQALKPHLVDV